MSTLTSTFATAFPGQVANLITAGRVVLLFLATAFAVSGDAMLAWVAVPLAFVALVMDWLDGYLARRLGCESKVGGVAGYCGGSDCGECVVGGICVVACHSAVGADCGAQQGVCDGCDSQLCPDQRVSRRLASQR